MEGQGTDVDAEECILAQHFYVAVLKVEGFMWNYGCEVSGEFVIGIICDRGIDGILVTGNVCDCDVGKSGDAGGRGMGVGGDRRFWDCIWLWDGGRFEQRGMRDLRFEVSVRKSQGCGNGSRSRVALVGACRV